MECLANTGFDASPWLVVAIIAVAAVVAGLLIAKRGRRAGIGTLTVLALGIAATLALAPAPNAHASASECPAPPSNSAQPTPAPTSESTTTTPDPTSSSPAPTSSTPEPTPTTTPTTDPTTPTSTTPTTPTTTACVPDQPVLWTAPEAFQVNAQPQQSGENEVSWAYTFMYRGADAAEVINKLGVTTTEGGTELKLDNVTGDPTVTPAQDGFSFSHVDGGTEGTDFVRLDVYFSKTATPAEIEAIMKDYAPPFGKKISATFPIKGAGTDCDGAPVDDEAVLAQCLPLRDVNIDSDGEATQLGNPGRSILSTESELNEGTDLHIGGSAIGTITPESLAPILEALSVTKLDDVTDTADLLTTPQTAGKYTLGKPTFTRDGTTVEIPAQFVPTLHIVNGLEGQAGKGLGITWNADFDGSTPEGEASAQEAWDQMRELMVPDGDQFASYPSELSIPVTVETECGPETITITVTGLSGQYVNPGVPGGGA